MHEGRSSPPGAAECTGPASRTCPSTRIALEPPAVRPAYGSAAIRTAQQVVRVLQELLQLTFSP